MKTSHVLSLPTFAVAALVVLVWPSNDARAQGGAAMPASPQNCTTVGGICPAGCVCRTDDKVGPPQLPLPPDCDSQKLKECMGSVLCNLKLAFSPPQCKITKDLCESLPGRRLLHTDDGDICISDDDKKCPNIKLFSRETSNDECVGYPIQTTNSVDPNDKSGPLGVSGQQFLSGGVPSLGYVIRFENLDTAGASAQEIAITDQLDATAMDLNTFSLGPITFGNSSVVPPPGVDDYAGSVDLRPLQNIIVTIKAKLDRVTGVASWHLLSVDPATLQLTQDSSAGFLPPNVNAPEGQGSVAFAVNPKTGITQSRQVCNKASIVFDTNAAIDTPQWCNNIDVIAPASAVSTLAPTQSSPTFTLRWSGSDAGAGVRDFTIFASENGSAFAPILSNTTATSTSFTGLEGKSYSFYSVATDRVGNVESAPSAPDATTTVASSPICASDVTGQITVTRGGFRLNLATRRYVQTLTLKNTGTNPLQGPLSVVLANLSSNAILFNAAGNTSCGGVTATPYIDANIGPDNVFSPGEVATVTLEFTNPTDQTITYSTRVLDGSGLK